MLLEKETSVAPAWIHYYGCYVSTKIIILSSITMSLCFTRYEILYKKYFYWIWCVAVMYQTPNIWVLYQTLNNSTSVAWPFLYRLINPVVVSPTIAAVGLSFYSYGFPLVGTCLEIGAVQILLVIAFSLVSLLKLSLCVFGNYSFVGILLSRLLMHVSNLVVCQII